MSLSRDTLHPPSSSSSETEKSESFTEPLPQSYPKGRKVECPKGRVLGETALEISYFKCLLALLEC